MFFTDSKYLSQYVNASDKQKKVCPGTHYYQKLDRFIEKHIEKGEEYIEYLKHSCKEKNGDIV